MRYDKPPLQPFINEHDEAVGRLNVLLKMFDVSYEILMGYVFEHPHPCPMPGFLVFRKTEHASPSIWKTTELAKIEAWVHAKTNEVALAEWA